MSRIEGGEQIVIDGGTGTEIERRGVPQLNDAWNGGGALSHPNILRQVHEDYILAGAQIITSNTFSALKSALYDAGVEEDFEAYNCRGVELACEARSALNADSVLVAGSISHWSWSGNYPSLDELGENASNQAVIMAEAGADLIMLEMMVKIDRMLAVLNGVQHFDLPVWVGFSCEVDSKGTPRLIDGDTLVNAIDTIRDHNVPLISIMHTDVNDVEVCLNVAEAIWPGPVGVYAHSGDYVEDKWIFENVINPEDYATLADQWLDRGVQVIGGCCGIGPNHIKTLSGLN